MNLTAYSDSESDSETPIKPLSVTKSAPKPSFQKVVDRSNPGRIKVSLAGASLAQARDGTQDDAPPAKKARLGGGALGGFNAMLPAPKKPNGSATSASTGATLGARSLGKALASGVNLKTGAEPAFKRECNASINGYGEDIGPIKKEPMSKDDFRVMLNLPVSKTENKAEAAFEVPSDKCPGKSQQSSKPAASRFVPMSVGKGKKKKPVTAPPLGFSEADTNASRHAAYPPQASLDTVKSAEKPKVSLWGVALAPEPTVQPSLFASYQPLLYGAVEEKDPPVPDNTIELQPRQDAHSTPASIAISSSGGLNSIASELNLSEAERRQLFGKNGKGGADLSSAKIVEFNTDTEYAHNEMLRQQGEQVQHNALKSISGTGKNSLRSLVSAAVTQKDALADHFAASHRNKREAGNRYGW